MLELIVTVVLLVALAVWALAKDPNVNTIGRVTTGVAAIVLAVLKVVPGL